MAPAVLPLCTAGTELLAARAAPGPYPSTPAVPPARAGRGPAPR